MIEEKFGNIIEADAEALVKWFHDYRDFVIKGSWYPDKVFKDMSTSHIIKYRPDPKSTDNKFKKLPSTIKMYELGQQSSLYGKLSLLRMVIWQTAASLWRMVSSTALRCYVRKSAVIPSRLQTTTSLFDFSS